MTDHDKDNWPKADNDTTIILVVATIAILVITAGYAYARHMIGLEVL